MAYRRIDELGRITVPKIIREELDINAGARFDVRIESGKIVLEKDKNCCVFCGEENTIIYSGKPLCEKCIRELKNM